MTLSTTTPAETAQGTTLGTLQEVRVGQTKPVFAPGIKSAIYKSPVTGLVNVTHLGCTGDMQTFHEHGGVDKALLWYCSSHYSAWKTELPEASRPLVGNGAFGENLVMAGVTEEDVCIGDVVSIGGGVLISVCEPRQPCYMLNHRFKVKNMAQRSQDSGRTGWYCRVVREGEIQAGDELVLVERPNPGWSVRRVQHYLYKEKRNMEVMEKLVELNGLGQFIKDLFRNRMKRQVEDMEGRLKGGEEEFHGMWSEYVLAQRHLETPRILSLLFKAKEPLNDVVPVLPGSHVRLKLGGDLVRAYSVVAGNTECFELGIALSEKSRGGSKYIHQKLNEGDTIVASQLTTSFPLQDSVDRHVFIAGGIGLTAFIAAAQSCEAKGLPYHLHYLVRNSEDVAFSRYLKQFGKNVSIYDKSAGLRCDLAGLLRKMDSLSHVYCCGSQRLMDSVKQTAKECGLSENQLHFEAFEVETSGDPFTARLQKSNRTVKVKGQQTLLDVLQEAGLDVSSSCEVGNCGTCRIDVLSGEVDHRGTGLMEWEKTHSMLSCVSRGRGEITLDL
jgi:MOSC domain-containing protein YiiM/ferredoxin-NADP reductase